MTTSISGSTGIQAPATQLVGSTSGVVTLQGQADAGTWTFAMPTSLGAAGSVLQADGVGGTSWTTLSGGGNVSSSGTPTSGQLAIWTGSATIQGVTNLPVTNLNNGTGASSTTFWRGDGTWASPAVSSSYSRTTITATAGQTSFTATYTVGYVQVFVNGILLNSADYTATSGTAIVLAVAASAGDLVDIIALTVGSFTAGTVVSVATTGNLTGGTITTSGTLDTVANPTFATSATSPLIIGGTGASSALTLQSTSGTGTSDSIIFKTGSQVTAMTVSTAGNVVANNTVVMGSSFLRNRIINGDMRIDQRNNGASVTPTLDGTYSVDRFVVEISVASKFSMQQVTTAPAGFTNSVKITSLSSYTSLAADYFAFTQKIEGYNFSDLSFGSANAKTITLSFQVYSSLTGTFGGSIENSAQNRSYPFSYSIASANTWTSISITIPGDTTGTWLTTNGIGAWVNFDLGCGSNFAGTANTWQAANYVKPTGAVSVVGTSGATLYLTGVQFEIGTVATPFERQIYSAQLQQCQRYFLSQTANQQNVTSTTNGSSVSIYYQFPVPMRAAPTLITQLTNANYSTSPTGNQWCFNQPSIVNLTKIGTYTVSFGSTYDIGVLFFLSATLSGQATGIYAPSIAANQFSAEL